MIQNKVSLNESCTRHRTHVFRFIQGFRNQVLVIGPKDVRNTHNKSAFEWFVLTSHNFVSSVHKWPNPCDFVRRSSKTGVVYVLVCMSVFIKDCCTIRSKFDIQKMNVVLWINSWCYPNLCRGKGFLNGFPPNWRHKWPLNQIIFRVTRTKRTTNNYLRFTYDIHT